MKLKCRIYEKKKVSERQTSFQYETYHGVFVNINYVVKCELKRSFLAKSIQKSQQFVVQYKVVLYICIILTD